MCYYYYYCNYITGWCLPAMLPQEDTAHTLYPRCTSQCRIWFKQERSGCLDTLCTAKVMKTMPGLCKQCFPALWRVGRGLLDALCLTRTKTVEPDLHPLRRLAAMLHVVVTATLIEEHVTDDDDQNFILLLIWDWLANLNHSIAVCIRNMCFQSSKIGLVVGTKVKTVHSILWILYLNFSVALWNDERLIISTWHWQEKKYQMAVERLTECCCIDTHHNSSCKWNNLCKHAKSGRRSLCSVTLGSLFVPPIMYCHNAT